MRKVVFVIGRYMNGGVARHSTVIANELAKAGYKVTLLATKGVGDNAFFRLESGVEVISLNAYIEQHSKDFFSTVYNYYCKIKILLLKTLFSLYRGLNWNTETFNHRIKAIRKGKEISLFLFSQPKAILIGFGIEYYYMALAGKRRKDRLIFAERNASQWEVPLERLSIAGKTLLRADASVFQTYDEIEYYKEFPLRNAVVIRNPISSDLPAPYNGLRRKSVVNFCRMSKQKNLKMLVDAFEKFHHDFPDYQCEIYGNIVSVEEEEIKEGLIKYISKRSLNDCVHILPPRADVHYVCRDAAMFVSTSYFEGLSNSMIEAMAIGLPCVCTDCLGGGAREIIVNGENGLLVPNEDVEACNLAMKRFVENPELADRCSRNAAKISQILSAENIGKEWRKVIEDIS